jgi:hypothetical protein
MIFVYVMSGFRREFNRINMFVRNSLQKSMPYFFRYLWSANYNFGSFHGSFHVHWEARGSLVVKALGYKPEGRGFETR